MSARWMPVLTVVALGVATVGAASRQRPETQAASPAEAPTEPFVAWSRERPSPPAREAGEATCGADGDSGIDLTDFRLGPVDPQVRICFDKEVWDGNADPNAPLRDLGVVVVKRGDRTLFRYPMMLQIPFEWSLAVDLMGLVQPAAPGRGPYFLIRYVVGAHSFQFATRRRRTRVFMKQDIV